MAPTTPLTSGYIYVCDYLTGTDGGDQDLNGKTEGTDYCKFKIPTRAQVKVNQYGTVQRYAGGTGHILKYDKRDPFRLSINGVVAGGSLSQSITDLGYVKSYLVSHKDVHPDYLFICFDYSSDLWYPFYDEEGTLKEYAVGWFRGETDTWYRNKNLQFMLKARFEVIWE